MLIRCSQCGATTSMMKDHAGPGDSSKATAVVKKKHKDRLATNSIVCYTIATDDYLSLDNSFQPIDEGKFDAPLWKKERADFEKHKRLFNLFAAIIPKEFRYGITDFHIIDPQRSKSSDSYKAPYAAIGIKNPESLSSFCLCVAFDLENYNNVIASPEDTSHNTLGYSLPIYTIIHEFGHYLTENEKQQDLLPSKIPVPKPGSILEKISQTAAYGELQDFIIKNLPSEFKGFVTNNPSDIKNTSNPELFRSRMLEYYKFIKEEMGKYKQELFEQGKFVTKYATESLNEDAAETFAHFVLGDTFPTPNVSEKDDKILLFYNEPEMVEIRAAIRDNLKKLGIRPNTNNLEGVINSIA